MSSSNYSGYYPNEGYNLTNYKTNSYNGSDIITIFPNFYYLTSTTPPFTIDVSNGSYVDISFNMNAPPSSFIFSSTYTYFGNQDEVYNYLCNQYVVCGWTPTTNGNTTTYESRGVLVGNQIATGAYIGFQNSSSTSSNLSFSSNTLTATLYVTNPDSFYPMNDLDFVYTIMVLA
jgi:hypothetical protein